MIRTAAVAFPITTFLAWWLYVTTRAGSGPGFKWDRVPQNISFTVAIVGSAYFVFLVIALLVLYFMQVRGEPTRESSVMLSALARLMAVFVLAIAAGATLAELFVRADERAFQKETEAFLAVSSPDPITGDLPLHSRQRWWPGSSNMMVSSPTK